MQRDFLRGRRMPQEARLLKMSILNDWIGAVERIWKDASGSGIEVRLMMMTYLHKVYEWIYSKYKGFIYTSKIHGFNRCG